MLTFPATFMSQDDGFLPTDVPDCGLWFDAADASTITEISGRVSGWQDKSGNNRHAFQNTVSARPLFKTDDGNYIDFEGDGVSAGDHLDFPNTSDLRTVFYVGDLDRPLNGISSIIGMNANGTRSYIFLVNTEHGGFTYGVSFDGAGSGDAGQWYVNGDFKASGQNTGNASDTPDGRALHRFVWNAGDPLTTLGIIGGIDPSGQRAYAGKFREIICYEGVPSAADTLAIETYLANKWGITLV